MGSGVRFRVGIALSAIGEGLREAARDFGGASLRCVCLPLSPAGSGHPPHKFITSSRPMPPIQYSGTFPNESEDDERKERTMKTRNVLGAEARGEREGTTLVLGGTGKTGRRVAERLKERALPVRVGSRSGKPP